MGSVLILCINDNATICTVLKFDANVEANIYADAKCGQTFKDPSRMLSLRHRFGNRLVWTDPYIERSTLSTRNEPGRSSVSIKCRVYTLINCNYNYTPGLLVCRGCLKDSVNIITNTVMRSKGNHQHNLMDVFLWQNAHLKVKTFKKPSLFLHQCTFTMQRYTL